MTDRRMSSESLAALTRVRRQYSEEFKRGAVNLITEQGYSVAEAAWS